MSSTEQRPYRGCVIAIFAAACLLSIGLAITADASRANLTARTASLYNAHLGVVASAANFMISVYISSVPAALTARHLIQRNIRVWNSSSAGPLSELAASVRSTFELKSLTFVTAAVIREEERPEYEVWLNRTCAPALGAHNLSIVDVTDRRPRDGNRLPRSANGLYPILTDAAVSGVDDRAVECAFAGLDFSLSTVRLQRLFEAIDSGRLTWQTPAPAVGAPRGQLNIGLIMPVHANSVEEAGRAGGAHQEYISLRPDIVSTLPWTCNRDGSAPEPPADEPCGHSRRAMGMVGMPMYPVTPLERLADAVPSCKHSMLSLLYIPPALHSRLTLEDGRTPFLPGTDTGALLLEPLPDGAYLADTYVQRTSWALKEGSLRDWIGSLTADDVLVSVMHDPSGSAGGGRYEAGAWRSRDSAAQALEAIRAADTDMQHLQAARAFALGRNVYVLVMRDMRGVMTPDFQSSQSLDWVLGACLSTLCAVLIPSIAYLLVRQQQRQHAMQIALVQSEKDGVVQAVAFAAHEIRNPMHGVLASLETALADLQPLITALTRLLAKPSSSSYKAEGVPGRQGRADAPSDRPGAVDLSSEQQSSAGNALCSALGRVLGPGACETVLTALEDVAVAKSSAEGCHRLVNDMVDYSKLQRGVMSIQCTDMPVREGLRAVLDSQRSFLHPNVRTFLGVQAAVPVCVYTDQVRILQVISNGLTNASKFTLSGEIYLAALRIQWGDSTAHRVPSNPTNEWLCIVTCDTGKGLAGVDVDNLLEPMKGGSAPSRFARGVASLPPFLGRWSRSSEQPPLTAKAAEKAEMEVHSEEGLDSVRPSERSSTSVSIGGSRRLRADTWGANTPSSPAVSASSVAKVRGSGLGLPVARLMARALGGDVDLYSEPSPAGAGRRPLTTFLFALPWSALTHGEGARAHYPLFGRSGKLPVAARQALRSKVREGFVELLQASGRRGQAQFASVSSSAAGAGEGTVGVGVGVGTEGPSRGDGQQIWQGFEELTTHREVDGGSDTDESASGGSLAPSGMKEDVNRQGRAGNLLTEDTALHAAQRTSVTSDTRDCAASAVAVPYGVSVGPIQVDGTSTAAAHVSWTAPSPSPAPAPAPVPVQTSGARAEESSWEADTGLMISRHSEGTTEISMPSRRSPTSDRPSSGATEQLRCVHDNGTAAHTAGSAGLSLAAGITAPDRAAVPPAQAAQPPVHAQSLQVPAVGSDIDSPVPSFPPSPAPLTLRVLYAEDDGTNRRLMERMVSRLSAQGLTKAAADGRTGTVRRPYVIDLCCASDGWEALCLLYERGHVDWATLHNARGTTSRTDGLLGMPTEERALESSPRPHTFDLILLDIDMPRHAGDRIASFVRAARAGVATPGGAGALLASDHVPMCAVTGRAAGLCLKNAVFGSVAACVTTGRGGSDQPSSSSAGCGIIGGSIVDSGSSPVVELVSNLPDPALDEVFDGALGKPFKASHLQALLTAVVRLRGGE